MELEEDRLSPLRLPEPQAWSVLGLDLGEEIRSGHQSRVFRADFASDRFVVKLTDSRRADQSFHQRVELLAQLAACDTAVVGPVQIGAELVIEIDQWLVVCFPFVEGRALSVENRSDVFEMAAVLASLHRSLASFVGAELPPVAALRGTDPGSLLGAQLVHDDFATANLIATDAGVRVIDFDDCGFGSVEFEIGNSLYMVLFDGWLAGDPNRYVRFRQDFVEAYRKAASTGLDEALLDEAIRLRFDALRRWVDSPIDAPIGIRSASLEWHEVLRSFLDMARP